MNKSKSIAVTYLTLMSMAFVVLFVVPLGIQLAVAPVTVSAATQPIYTLQKNLTEPVTWSESTDIPKEFILTQSLPIGTNIVVSLKGHYSCALEGTWDSVSRNTSIRYTLYCNGVEANKYRYDILKRGANANKPVIGSLDYSNIIIPKNLVSIGQNMIRIHVEIESVQRGSGQSSFTYRVDDTEVNVKYADSDGDKVSDYLDLAPSVSNMNILTVVGFVGFPPSFIFGKKLSKLKNTNRYGN